MAAATASMPIPDFDAIYNAHAAFVWTNARRLGIPADQVEDVVQDVFVVVYRRMVEFTGRSSLKTWVWGILTNVVRDRRRRFRRKESNEAGATAGDLPAEGVSPDEQAAAAEALRMVQAVLEQLSEDKRELFILAQLEGMSAPEIAEAVGDNLNTVYARIRAVRREFDQAYEMSSRETERVR